MPFEFSTATRIVFGPGRLKELGGLARGFGRYALVVTGRHPNRAERLLDLLRKQDIAIAVLSTPGEPLLITFSSVFEFNLKSRGDKVLSNVVLFVVMENLHKGVGQGSGSTE